jgi:hypothetical protein
MTAQARPGRRCAAAATRTLLMTAAVVGVLTPG